MKIITLTPRGKQVNTTAACATPSERDLMFRIKLNELLNYDNLTTGEKRIATQLVKMGLVTIK